MNPKRAWLFFQYARWLLCLGAIEYYISFIFNRSSHGPVRGLTHTTKYWLFGLPLGAVAAGLFEMMTRERAGIPRDRKLLHTNKRTETGPGAGNERPIGP